MANLVPSVVLEGVAELIEQNGQDPVELFRRVGIPEAALLEPNVLIRPEHYASLLELAAVECSDRFFCSKGWLLTTLRYHGQPVVNGPSS